MAESDQAYAGRRMPNKARISLRSDHPFILTKGDRPLQYHFMDQSGRDIYQSDPGRRPDSEFTRGEPRYLVVGNAARLLDARRTPVMITGLDLEEGLFEVEIKAFEDRG